jgi:hypothetical protein
MLATIEIFSKAAIAEDPNYAVAHAQLGYCYVWTALFIEPTNPQWARLAREEIKRAQALDPYLAESHRANALLLWSAYEGFQNEAALRELLLAKQLNPGVGDELLAVISEHLGLVHLSDREMKLALDIDPTSRQAQDLPLTLYSLRQP